MSVNGLIQGCLPIMRFNYGAGKQARVKSAFRYGTAYASIMMLLGTLVLAIIPTQLLSLFAASESMQEFGKSAMRIMSVGYLFCGFTTMIATYFQAIDRVIESNILQLMRQLIVLLPTTIQFHASQKSYEHLHISTYILTDQCTISGESFNNCNMRFRVSLPFSADFRYLGRDFQPAAPGFSTHMRNIRRLGRDSQPKKDATRLPITP